MTAQIGHNSVDGSRLNAYIHQIEKLEDERQLINLTIRDLYNEAKQSGFDSRTIRRVIAERKIPQEQLDLFSIYKMAIG
jgi:uncharacterized protein (UPF0335 family)